jgi:hypothetical protein
VTESEELKNTATLLSKTVNHKENVMFVLNKFSQLVEQDMLCWTSNKSQKNKNVL